MSQTQDFILAQREKWIYIGIGCVLVLAWFRWRPKRLLVKEWPYVLFTILLLITSLAIIWHFYF